MAEIDLNLNPELICNIILKLKEFQTKEDVVFSEDTPDAGYEDDLTYQEVKAAIDELEEDQQYTLAALFFIGNDAYSIDDWASAIDEANNIEAEKIADFLLGTPQSPDYIRDGLMQLGIECDI